MLIVNKLSGIEEYLEAIEKLNNLYEHDDVDQVPEMKLEKELLEMITLQYEKENTVDVLSVPMKDYLKSMTSKHNKETDGDGS